MTKKEKITSNFIGLKAMALLFFVAAPYIYFVQDDNPLRVAIWGTILIWSVSALFWIYAITRNKVYYDQERFYVYDWKGKEVDIIPNEKITSMFGANSFGQACRLFYDAEDGNKKEFWIFPNLRINTETIEKRLKEINPNLLTMRMPFGGIEHLFIRKEDGFR